MTIQELKKQCLDMASAMDDAQLAVEVLMCFVFHKSKEDLFLNHQAQISEASAEELFAFMHRYLEGEPVAYLIGNKEFYGLDFFVDSRVLIPRPESEILVDKVLEFVSKNSSVKHIIDVGTGSGCLAVSLAYKLPDVQVTGVDVSPDALEVARFNASKHGVLQRCLFFQSDLLTMVEDPHDVVVANLPYIGLEKFNFVSRETKRYEPNVALFGGADGLDLYRKLFGQILAKPWKPQLLLGEFGFLQADDMRKLLEENFAKHTISIIEDYASIPRVFVVAFRQ